MKQFALALLFGTVTLPAMAQQMPPDLQALRSTFADLVLAKVNADVRAMKAEAERDALQQKLDKLQSEHKP